jgi:hypothetical protein
MTLPFVTDRLVREYADATGFLQDSRVGVEAVSIGIDQDPQCVDQFGLSLK